MSGAGRHFFPNKRIQLLEVWRIGALSPLHKEHLEVSVIFKYSLEEGYCLVVSQIHPTHQSRKSGANPFQHSLQFVSAMWPCLLWRAEEKNLFLSLLGLDLTTLGVSSLCFFFPALSSHPALDHGWGKYLKRYWRNQTARICMASREKSLY